MLLLFYVFLFFYIIFFEFFRKKDNKFDYLTIFNIFFISYYIFPAIMILIELNEYTNRYIQRYNVDYNFEYSMTWIIIVMAYFFVVLGFYLVPKYVPSNKSTFIRVIPNEERFKKRITMVLIIVGTISLIIYAMNFGGIKQLFLYSNAIRNATVESNNPSLEFFRRLIPAYMIASYFFYSSYLENKNIVKLLIAVILASIWFFIHAGRAAILTYVIILFLIMLFNNKKKISIIKLWKVGILSILGINYLRPLFMSMQHLDKGFNEFIEAFTNYASSGRYLMRSIQDFIFMLSDSFSHMYISLETSVRVVNSGVHNINFFYDFLIAIISLIPSVLLPFEKPYSIASYNTMYITGYFQSQIPPGGVAFGYYSLSWIGVIMFSLFVGIIGKKISNYFISFQSNFGNTLYVVCMFLWVELFFNGEPRHTLQRNFVLIVLLLFIKLRAKKYKIKHE
ncbi:MAG: O-antigen polymerase [bacterium]